MKRRAHRAPRRARLRPAAALATGVLVVGMGVPAAAGFVGPGLLPDGTSAPGRAEPAAAVATPTPRPTLSPAEAAEPRAFRPPVQAEKLRRKPPARPPAEPTDRLKKKAEKAATEPPPPATGPMTIRIGTFNVLGSQHTGPRGDRRNFPPASVRTPAAARLAGKHGVDILGTQELQGDQLRGLGDRLGMAAYPGYAWGEAETDNSILYDDELFELVSGSKFTLTFMGRSRPQPIVRLRHRESGREFYVVNTHPSAGGGRYLTQRRRGQAALVGVVNNLKSTGLPVLVTGDMNDRGEFYCRVVPPAGLTAANGGSYGNGCRPPKSPLPVDWVVGSGATWTNYWRDTTPVNKRISDHFFISATAYVG